MTRGQPMTEIQIELFKRSGRRLKAKRFFENGLFEMRTNKKSKIRIPAKATGTKRQKVKTRPSKSKSFFKH
jgi:hypothetical protein